MSGKELQVHVGGNLDTMGQRFVDAWHRAERGELTEANAERHLGFETFELFARVMTPRRLELLATCIAIRPAASARCRSRWGGITGGCMRMWRRW